MKTRIIIILFAIMTSMFMNGNATLSLRETQDFSQPRCFYYDNANVEPPGICANFLYVFLPDRTGYIMHSFSESDFKVGDEEPNHSFPYSWERFGDTLRIDVSNGQQIIRRQYFILDEEPHKLRQLKDIPELIPIEMLEINYEDLKNGDFIKKT